MAREARTSQMTLKLDVPWRPESPLQVNFCVTPTNYNKLIAGIEAYEGAYLHPNERPFRVRNFFEDNNRVHDVSRYYIREGICRVVHDGRYCICNDRYIIPHCDLSGQTIYHGDIREQDLGQHLQEQPGSVVLLLESPHTDEYGMDLIDRKGPAVSRTGAGGRIDRCLDTVLMHIQLVTGLIASGSHVVISNPIQFQTSLHAIHGQPVSNSPWDELRDNVWRTLWNESRNHLKQCFLARLGSYHPKVIINACTSSLKPCVTSCVKEWNNGRNPVVPLYEVAHPAHWQDLRPKLINSQAIPNAGNL